MQKCITLIIVLLLGFAACSDDVAYRIEGKLSNLEDPTIYVVFENESGKLVDTLICEADGKFEIERREGDYNTATLFWDNRTQWRTLFLEHGKKVRVTGDAHYAALLHVKGGSDINDKLSDMHNSSANLWKERTELINKIERKVTNPIEDVDLMAKLTNVNHQLEEEAIAYIKKHPNEAVSLVLIQQFFTNPDDTREADELLALISTNLRGHFIYKSLNEYSARAKRTSIGAEAPGFKVKNLFKKDVDLAAISGKYVLLTFTSPWCEMSKAEDLYLTQIATKYKSDGLDMIVVTLDENAAKLRELIKEDSVQWNLVTDSAGQASALIDLYNVSELPSYYLIDQNKKILLKSENNIEIRDTLEELLGD